VVLEAQLCLALQERSVGGWHVQPGDATVASCSAQSAGPEACYAGRSSLWWFSPTHRQAPELSANWRKRTGLPAAWARRSPNAAEPGL